MESTLDSFLSNQLPIFHMYFLLFIISFLCFLINKIAKRTQNLPPIPSQCLPIIGHLHLRKKPQIYARLAEKYGPILMLYFGSRPVLLISSPSLMEECLGKNDIIFANRPQYLAGKLLGYDYTTLIWASYGPLWRNLRKIATIEILSSSRVQKTAGVRAGEVHAMLRRLSGAPRAEMKVVFFELSMNVMMRMIAGKRYYGGGEEQKTEEARRFREMIREASLQVVPTNLVDHLPFLRWFGFQIPVEKIMKSLQARRDGFMQYLIDERKETAGAGAEENTMLDVFLSLQRDEPEYYTDDIIKGMMQTMLVGGSETTALVMEWAFALLLNHPIILKKAYQEIQNHMGKSNRLIQDSDLGNFPYLQAIIDETMRLYAVTNVIGQHETSKECVVGGYSIPRGTILFLNMRFMHNNPEIWDEPREFRPERFMGAEKEQVKLKYLPFGLGRRRCPAEGFSKQFLALALGSLIHCFEWSRVGSELVDMSEFPKGLNLARSQPLLAECKPRLEIVKLLPHDG